MWSDNLCGVVLILIAELLAWGLAAGLHGSSREEFGKPYAGIKDARWFRRNTVLF